MKMWQISALSLASLGLMTGCTPNINADYYQTSNTQQVSVVKHGTIVSESQVKVSDSGASNTLVGTLAGGAAGAVLGSTVGQGSGSALAAIGGAVLGGIAGSKTEQALSSQMATQYIVQLTDGSTLSVTQGGTPIAVGTKVLLLEGDPARLIVDTSVEAAVAPAAPAVPTSTAPAASK
jgi:outer membrane lipoprotein SlyB